MIKTYIDHGPRHDDDGRRLPPYIVTHAVCDLCKAESDPVYGDSDWDKGLARAKAGLEFVHEHGRTRELCKSCRTMRLEYEDKAADDFGRREFFLYWRKRYDHDEQGKFYSADDETVHVRDFGQIFHTQPEPLIQDIRARGFIVEIVEKR